jgi:hypothetical protein
MKEKKREQADEGELRPEESRKTLRNSATAASCRSTALLHHARLIHNNTHKQQHEDG